MPRNSQPRTSYWGSFYNLAWGDRGNGYRAAVAVTAGTMTAGSIAVGVAYGLGKLAAGMGALELATYVGMANLGVDTTAAMVAGSVEHYKDAQRHLSADDCESMKPVIQN